MAVILYCGAALIERGRHWAWKDSQEFKKNNKNLLEKINNRIVKGVISVRKIKKPKNR